MGIQDSTEEVAEQGFNRSDGGNGGKGVGQGESVRAKHAPDQSRAGVQSALGRIRQAAEKDVNQQLTALYHHVYNVDLLRESYYALNRKAALGVDGVT